MKGPRNPGHGHMASGRRGPFHIQLNPNVSNGFSKVGGMCAKNSLKHARNPVAPFLGWFAVSPECRQSAGRGTTGTQVRQA